MLQAFNLQPPGQSMNADDEDHAATTGSTLCRRAILLFVFRLIQHPGPDSPSSSLLHHPADVALYLLHRLQPTARSMQRCGPTLACGSVGCGPIAFVPVVTGRVIADPCVPQGESVGKGARWVVLVRLWCAVGSGGCVVVDRGEGCPSWEQWSRKCTVV